MLKILVLLTAVCTHFFASKTWAYPQFISHSYTSCLTCHFNGLGGGALNDYGRALWAAELSAKWFTPSVSDEALAESSGFLGKTQLPVWFRPAIKYRGLHLTRSAFSGQKVEKYYHMQVDANMSFMTEDQKYLLSVTYGHVPTPQVLGTDKFDFQAREYFLRIEMLPSWWIYVGLLEKTYGLRNIDHTSYQRNFQGFQIYPNAGEIGFSHGAILHKVEEKWELSLGAFTGHPLTDTDKRQNGVSAMYEFNVGDNSRLGISGSQAKSEIKEKQMLGVSYKQSVGKGSAFLFEQGLVKDTNIGATTGTTGSYTYIESYVQLQRGLNYRASLERYNPDFSSGSEDRWKLINGLLIFPGARLEFRTDAVLYRNISEKNAPADVWGLQGQLHVSL